MSERATVCTASGVPLVDKGSTTFPALHVASQLAAAHAVETKEWPMFAPLVGSRDLELNW